MPLPRADAGTRVCMSTILPLSQRYSILAISPSGNKISNRNSFLLFVTSMVVWPHPDPLQRSGGVTWRTCLGYIKVRHCCKIKIGTDVIRTAFLDPMLSALFHSYYFAWANSRFSIIVTSSPTIATPSFMVFHFRLNAARLILLVALKPALMLPYGSVIVPP